MSPTDTLEVRLADALRAQADGLVVDDRPFTPSADADGLVELDPAEGRGPRRHRWPAAVAVAASICVLVALWGVRSDHPRPAETDVGPTTVARPDDPVLGEYPSSVPDSLDLISATASRWSDPRSLETQLFGTAEGTPKLLITIQAMVGSVSGGQPTTVRGQPAVVLPAKDFASSTSTLSWNEGTFVEASYSGMTTAQAESLLDSLHWTDPTDHLLGYSAASGGSLVRLGQTGRGAAQDTTQLELDYADAVGRLSAGQGRQLMVRTTAVGGSGEPTADYLEVWFNGSRQADGMVESYDPAFGTLSWAWPDGRSVWLDADATDLTQAQLRQVASGLRDLDQAGYHVLVAEAAATIRAQLPLVGITSTAHDVVEVHADDSLAAVCVAPKGSSWTCSAPAPTAGGPVAISTLLGNAWEVVGAARTPVTVQPAPLASGPELPVDTATVGGWYLTVADPPVGVDQVLVIASGQGQGMVRPPA